MVTSQWNWDSPGVIVDAPTPDSDLLQLPTSFDALEFSPQGVYDLRRMLGALPNYPGQFTAHSDRFLASDIAWFAAGCSTDNQHNIDQNTFHPVLSNMYKNCEGSNPRTCRMLRQATQKLVFDLVTLWDRAFGGSTMVVHVDGPTVPDTPPAPQFIKAQVYLPPSTVVKELPNAHKPLASMVQTFIEEVGIHTQLRWERVGKSYLGWNLSGSSAPRRAPRPLAQYVNPIPPSLGPNSSVYIFHGRPFAETTSSITPTNSANPLLTLNTAVVSPAASVSDTESDYEPSYLSHDFLEEFDRANWHLERESFKHREVALQEQVSQLEHEISALEDEVRSLKQTLQRSNGKLSGSTTDHFFVPDAHALEGIHLPASRTSNQAAIHLNKGAHERFNGTIAPPSSPSKDRSIRQQGPSTPTKALQGGPLAADVCSPSVEVRTAEISNINKAKEIAPRAKKAVALSGYNLQFGHIVELVFTNVQQAFWHSHLLRYGFKDEDIASILTAMMEDMVVS